VGGEVSVGPIPVGPGGLAVAEAVGRIGPVGVERMADRLVSFVASVPIDLSVEVRIAGARHRYSGNVSVPLRLTARTAEPLTLVIEMPDVVMRDVRVSLAASGVGARVLQRLGNVDDQVRRHVVQIANERLCSESARSARVIDVVALIDAAWDVPSASGRSGPAC
jgi:hypothetical protein